MRYFYVDHALKIDQITTVTGADARHIQRVLRLKAGQAIGLFDDNGMAYEAMILACRRGAVQVKIIQEKPTTAESPTEIIIGQAVLKDRKMDILIRHLTELGITRWLPFYASRCVAQPKTGRLTARMQRWQTISREAMKQSKRGRSMDIGTPVSFDDALARLHACDIKILFSENETLALDTLPQGPSATDNLTVAAFLGPEGGFTDHEVALARDCGFVTVSLGPRILRSETATISAAVLLQYLFGDLGKKY
jgi:16S rRNA (uracil1498-N3)-methyltransferase